MADAGTDSEWVSAGLPTLHGDTHIYVYRGDDGKEHVALVFGEVRDEEDVLVRIHSECLTSEVLGSTTCDCREQLHATLAAMGAAGRGILLYLRQEGRGIGLLGKVKAYRLQQEQGLDTMDANIALGESGDARTYEVALAMLAKLRPASLVLLTNNPNKVGALREAGWQVRQQALVLDVGAQASAYLQVKADKFGHRI